MVENARASYFADLISRSKRNPKVLFYTINVSVPPAPSGCTCPFK